MSLPFDRRLVAPCLVQENCFDPNDPTDGDPNDPGDGTLRLIIKPEAVSKCALEQLQFETYLVSNGAEQKIELGLTYVSSNQGIVIIGAATGAGTAFGEGMATVTVTWQHLSASAQVTTLGGDCCEDQNVGMVVAIDNSTSMGQAFSGTYSSRFILAKELANNLAAELNTTKDKIGVVSFNEVAHPELALSDDISAIQTAIGAISLTTLTTNLFDAIETAIEVADADTTLERKVIVLFSDGENKTGADPLVLAESFKSGGGIIIVVGLRASGAGFTLLNQIASGGFFINATTDNEEDVNTYLQGLKGYFCAGNCVPEGDEIVNKGQLNYDDFLNWDAPVASGPVDLIGGTYPHQLFDFVPSNGLYVDLHGSSAPWRGILTSKTTFALQAGQQYELRVRLAGNQRSGVPRTTQFLLGDIDEVLAPDWKEGFGEHAWTTTPGILTNSQIVIQDIDLPTSSFGNLLDYVRLKNLTTDTVLLEDDFDDENPTYIEPNCGSAVVPYGYDHPSEGETVYGYDGCYGSGCLEAPIPAQSPDASPLPDIE